MTSLKLVISSGEALSLEEARNFYKALPNAKLLNLYGSSELGADVTAYLIEKLDGLYKIPIGRPIDNIQLLVCNPQLQLMPQGIPGELLVGGLGLARGYLNRSELTAEKFIPNPFYDNNNLNSSERLYKTGDLVRWLPDGNLEFLGRIDHQVKIRGFRIELGEIESALTSHDLVKDAVVVTGESANGDKHIVAYIVVASATESPIVEQLRQHLSQSLPDYMVPAIFVVLDNLPLSPNGKVDRKALQSPDFSSQQTDYVAPRSDVEKVLCEIWQDVLGVEQVGVTDNFFQLGGHSLLANQAVSRIRQNLHVELPVRALFEAPTPQGLDQHIKTLLRIKHDRLQSGSINKSGDREEIQL
jgi:acyl-coenzyme A synthetase/AMP-(fatty) acid ligase